MKAVARNLAPQKEQIYPKKHGLLKNITILPNETA